MKTKGLVAFLLLTACFIVSFGASLQGSTMKDKRNCPETEKTMQPVSVCPRTHEEWTKASEEMGCSSIKQNCNENPSFFVFHCVKGTDGVLYKLCAVKKNIVVGVCVGYSIEGQRLEENLKENCTKFTTNPCPKTYLSTIIYQFPGCYEGANTTETIENDVCDIETSTTVTTTQRDDICMQNSTYGTEDENNTFYVHPGVGAGVAIALVVILVIMCAFYMANKQSGNHSPKKKTNGTDRDQFQNACLLGI